ncbi:hypothetical protein [Marinobacter sp.]|uniref:hypothetical protein n=1 Tax=Marinobacter sp. TaxID=50741 RepID=UPI0019B1CBFB|nr:hypothetical protein [Marinobacter sp.]MBD3655939.1 hypothetical protein [Marinobacter sp.]
MTNQSLIWSILKNSNLVLRPSVSGELSATDERRLSFDVISGGDAVVGYVKTWNDVDGYSGYVYFDIEGNVLDWMTSRRPSG